MSFCGWLAPWKGRLRAFIPFLCGSPDPTHIAYRIEIYGRWPTRQP